MAPKRTGKPPYRPEKPIDWNLVDKLLLCGCTGAEICPHFDMHHDTFYRRVQETYGMSFTAYASEKRQKGDSLLRQAQFAKALKGDNTMLVWLGKNRLKQKESPSEEINENSNESKQLESLIKELQNLQAGKSSLTIDKTINNDA